MPSTSRSRKGWLVAGAILFALVAQKAVRIVISRLPDKPERGPAVLPLPPGKPVGELHFIAGHPRILLTGNRPERLKAALATPAGVQLKETVDAQMRGDKQYGFRGYYAAFLYRLTGDPKYATYAVSFIDAYVTAEEQKIAKGQTLEVEFDSYLLAGELVGDVALTYDWCFDRVSEGQKKRWLAYADQAVWNIWNFEKANWGGKSREWSGWATDNPNNNYYSAFLEATMLFGLAARGEHPRADEWVKAFRKKHIGDELGPTFDRDLQGGGSREGTGYGGQMRRLFRLYDLWESATGERIADLTPQTKDCLPYAIHATLPTLDRMATIGDQARESTGALFDFHRDYVQMLVYDFRRDPLAQIGQWWLSHSSVKEMTQPYSFFYDVVWKQSDLPERPLKDLYPVYYAAGIGNLFARTSWETDATWFNFLAGPKTESHAHRDLGSFVIYKKEWLAYDAVIDSGSGLRREEAAHNLVEFTKGGKPVKMLDEHSATVTALQDDPAFLYVAADVTPMYPEKAGVSSQREVVWVKPDTFVVFDRVSAKGPIAKTWHLSTPHKPAVNGNAASIQGKTSNLTVTALLPSATRPAVVAWKTVDSDYAGGYRLDIPAGPGESSQFLTVLSVDGAVARASGGATDPAGPTAQLALKDGRTVRVQFRPAEWGGSLEITGGTRPVKQPLKPGVARLPVFAR